MIITITVISFVVFFSPDQRWGQERGASGLVIDGRRVTNQQYQQARQETRLLYLLNFGKTPEEDKRAEQMNFDVDNETLTRLLRLAKVKEMGIEVSDEAVGALARRIVGPEGNLDVVIRQNLQPRGFSADDFERFLRHDAAIQQLGAVAGLSGKLVTPREAAVAYRQDHEAVKMDAVFFAISNYLPAASVTDPAVMTWYSNNMARFRIPERMRVEYVAFSASNFVAEADKQFASISNLNERLEEAYYRLGTNQFKDAQGKPLSKAAALEKIKQEDRDKMAMQLAFRKANDFAGELYDKPHTIPAFASQAASNGLKLEVSLPFDQMNPPTNLDVAPEFSETAFKLTREEPIDFQPIRGEHAWYLFALKDNLPSENPPFDTIREKVLTEFRRSKAQEIMFQTARSFHEKLTNALAQGQSFSNTVSQSNLKILGLPPISRATESLPPDVPESINLRYLKSLAFSVQPGKASTFIPAPPDGGFIVFVEKKLPLDEKQMQQDMPKFLAQLRQSQQNEAFGLWFRRIVEKSNLPFKRKDKAGATAEM